MSAAACPCCGGRTLEEPDVWGVCPACGWIDDPHQSADPAEQGGANGISLEAARDNFRETGSAKRRPAGSA